MLVSALKTVLIMSCVCTVSGVLLLLLRPITQKIWSSKVRAKIWYVVLLMALVPLSVSFTYENAPVYPAFTESLISGAFEPGPAGHQITAAAANEVTKSEILWNFVSLIWLTVMIIVFAKYIVGYFVFLKTIKSNSGISEKYKNINVRTTNVLSAPLTVGLFKKTIYIPANSENTDKTEYILMHEYTHIKNCDIFMKWVCMIVKCVHWFNPVINFICAAIDEDCEIACDCESTASLALTEKKQYMNTILSLISATSDDSGLTTRMANSKQSLTKRFAAISFSKKRGKIFRCISFVTATTAMSVLLIGSGILCENIYGDCIPSISLSFSAKKPFSANVVTSRNALLSEPVSSDSNDSDAAVKTEADEAPVMPNTDIAEIYTTKTSDLTQSTDSTAASEYETENVNPTYEFSFDTSNEVLSEEAIPSLNAPASTQANESDKNSHPIPENVWFFENTDDSPTYYPYGGQVKLDGLTMDALRADIEKSGTQTTNADNANLSTGYISDTLSYKNGSINEAKNVTCDENGHITFYMNSDYERHITVSFSEDGKQIAGYGMVPDNETIYVFGGFDPNKTYDITVSSETGETWKVESDYIIY